MRSVCFLFVSLAVCLAANANPQVLYKQFALAENQDSLGRQYYAVEYLGNSPQHPAVKDYNLNHGDVDAPNGDSYDGNDSINFSYNSGIVEIVNDEENDSSMMPYDANPDSINGQSIAEDDDDEEDNEDTQDEVDNQSSLGAKVNETVPAEESTTQEPLSEGATDSPIELFGTNDNTTSSTTDKITAVFIHPIYRPSSEWPLGNKIAKPGKKPSKKPQKGEQPLRNRNKKPKPLRKRVRIVTRKGGHRRPVNRLPIRYSSFRSSDGFSSRQDSNARAGSNSCRACQCGVTTTRRIVGGKVAAVNELPWMTLITYNDTIQCSGTLINDRYVLTAAHCVRGFAKELFELQFLEYDTESSMDTVSLRRKISRVHSLKTYVDKTSDDDIAILKLSEPIDFETSTVRPICLPPQKVNLNGETGIIAGWGTAAEAENPANALQTTLVPILSSQQCLLVGMKITDNMLCTGRLLDGEINACQGDSGGPLMVIRNKRHLLAGVVSWGDGCAKPLKPGIYARVTRYLPWINRKSNGSCKCK